MKSPEKKKGMFAAVKRCSVKTPAPLLRINDIAPWFVGAWVARLRNEWRFRANLNQISRSGPLVR